MTTPGPPAGTQLLPAPPKIPLPRQPPQPDWWAKSDTRITRSAFLRLWTVEVIQSGTAVDQKTLDRELNAWSSGLSRTDWVDRYGPRTAELLRQSNIATGDLAAWHDVSGVVASFVEPLARYSSGWVKSVEALRPRVPADVGRAIREMGRRAVVPIRRDLIADDVIATQQAAIAFVLEQEPWHATHTRIVLDEYLTRLRRYLSGLALRNDPTDHKLRSTLAEHYLLLTQTDRAVSVPDAASTTSTPTTGGVRSTAISTRRLKPTTKFSGLLGARKLEVDLRDEQLRQFARIWIARDPTQRLDDESLCWEARFSMDVLDDPDLLAAGVLGAIDSRWTEPAPSTARSRSKAAAARYAELLMLTARNTARSIGDA